LLLGHVLNHLSMFTATLLERAQNLSFVCNLGPLLQAPPFSRKPTGFNPVATPLVLGIN